MNQTVDVTKLVYGNEKTLFALLAVIAALFWLLLVAGTLGVALLYVAALLVGYLFAQSGLIAWIQGNGVRLTEEQFPDLYRRYQSCCQALGMSHCPDAYLIHGGGVLNAFATRFLGRDFVVLYSNVVDAMVDQPEAIQFYMGHELGHIRRRHLTWGPLLWPATLLPLLGAAYSRAREYTCDQFGRACCAQPEAAMRGLAALAAGDRRWALLNLPAYLRQTRETSGFWMSFHELVADYPWLVKRAARLENPEYRAPGRHPLAWLLAIFVPRLGFGGGAAGLLVVVAIGIAAAVAIPAYMAYQQRAAVLSATETEAAAMPPPSVVSGKHMEPVAVDATSELGRVLAQAEVAKDAVARFAAANDFASPATLADTGYAVPADLPVESFALNDGGVLSVRFGFDPVRGAELRFTPRLDEARNIVWQCQATGLPADLMPAGCG